MAREDVVAMAQALLRAQKLDDVGAHAEAGAAYAVAADAAEELDVPGVALAARNLARRSLVAAWAQQRWPAEWIHISDVVPLRKSSEELTFFGVRRPRRPAPRRGAERQEFTYVVVGRAGRIRVV